MNALDSGKHRKVLRLEWGRGEVADKTRLLSTEQLVPARLNSRTPTWSL